MALFKIRALKTKRWMHVVVQEGEIVRAMLRPTGSMKVVNTGGLFFVNTGTRPPEFEGVLEEVDYEKLLSHAHKRKAVEDEE